jgi:hypothetical protein
MISTTAGTTSNRSAKTLTVTGQVRLIAAKNNPALPRAKAAGSNGLTDPLVVNQTLTPTKAAANPINK